MTIRVIYKGKRFLCVCPHEDRLLPKGAGFTWDRENCVWYTRDLRAAVRLRAFCSKRAEKELTRHFITKTPWSGGLSHPAHLSVKNFQKTAIRFSLVRNRSYLALRPGLGKSICAAVIAATWGGVMLFISPPHLLLNAEAEFKKWTSHLKGFRVVTGAKYEPPKFKAGGAWIVPDSMLQREEVTAKISEWSNLHERKVLCVDEQHRFKSITAKRTKALFLRILPHFLSEKAVFMSGTHMPNRPIELYPVLSKAAPETIDFMTEFQYAVKYCDAFRGKWGWDYSGASNTKELGRRVRANFMLKMLKEDVLKELPPKTEEIVFIGDKVPAKIRSMERKILSVLSPQDLIKGVISAKTKSGEALPIATYRRELGLLKVKKAAEFIRAELEGGDESFLVFAIHKGTISLLEKSLAEFKPLVITGKTPMSERQKIVQCFQEKKSRRIFLGNIQAAGTGFTLTKATQVIFAEFSWSPGDNDQAADRAHRIGQKNHVLVRYLVYRDSIDKTVLETIFRKREVISHV